MDLCPHMAESFGVGGEKGRDMHLTLIYISVSFSLSQIFAIYVVQHKYSSDHFFFHSTICPSHKCSILKSI